MPRRRIMRARRDEPRFVYDGRGRWLGLVVECAPAEHEAYALPRLALIGVFRTRAAAADSVARVGLYAMDN